MYICAVYNQITIMRKIFILIAVAGLVTVPADAQLLNRLADRAVQAAERGVTKAIDKKTEQAAQKAAEKMLGGAEKALDQQVDKAAKSIEEAAVNATQAYTDAMVESAAALNASAAELNAATDSLRRANEAAGIQTNGAGLAGLMGSYMTLMGAGTPTYEDKGNEVVMNWQYIQFTMNWTARFRGDKCTESVIAYIFPTPELATEFYRDQIDGLDRDEAKKYRQDDKTVYEDNSDEFADQDKVAVKAAIQKMVLAMGGKLE